MSVQSVFNKQGVPLMFYGNSVMAVTKGAPIKPTVSKQIEIVDDKSNVDKYEVAAWGASNDFPQEANKVISTISVLNTGLKFIRNFTIGQGIFPCMVTGYTDDGNEILNVVNDKDVVNFIQSRVVRRYLEKVTRDYLKFGCANVELLFDESKSSIVGINTLNALHTRYTVAKNGVIEKVIVSGKWPDNPAKGEYEAIDLLDEYDPIGDLEIRRVTNKINALSYVYPVRDAWSNSEYYSEPVWLSAHLAGWTDVARVVPQFLLKAYENQITWKWHIQIPYAFWDKKFPAQDYPDIKTRQAAIENYMDNIEENLTGTVNANKPLFTMFEINQNGRAEEQWIITPLDNKHKEGDKLITSAAANSEILFSLMLNPNVLGAGMPGGTYAGNQGGSNIREAFLVNIANAWIDRQNILDPLEALLHFNGKQDIQLRFRSTILTTLDTGAGTTKKLS
jgi:hypothetical protein